MQAVITLSECLAMMRTGEPFDLVWVTADRQRRRGGEILTAEGACQVIKRKPGAGPPETADRNPDSGPQSPKPQHPSPKNPNHYAHGTRNIRLASGKVRKVHIQLIDSINGMKVV